MQYKHGKQVGYETSNHPNGTLFYCHNEKGCLNGYLIMKDPKGNLYRGEFCVIRDSLYGHIRCSKNHEGDGLWKRPPMSGTIHFVRSQTRRFEGIIFKMMDSINRYRLNDFYS